MRRKGGTIDGKYEASVAEQKAYVRRKYAKYQGKKINEDYDLRTCIIYVLFQGWTPDEISVILK